jgi:chromosome segregation ATPase
MSYEAFRISFQDSEQAARAAYDSYADATRLLRDCESKLDACEKERDRAVARASRIAELDPDGERADDDMQEALREIESLTVSNINLQNELAAAADVELMRFYTVENVPALVKALSHHVEKLQDKLQRLGAGPQERIRTAVREG